jgi:hypothetical protein
MSLETKAVRKTKASFETVLVDAGFAALVLLKKTTLRGTSFFFASAIVDDQGTVSSYFVVAASKQTTLDYFLGATDLHYVYIYANESAYYQLDSSDIFSDDIELSPFGGIVPDDVIPDRGFFARDHNVDYSIVEFPPSTHNIAIDGQWRMSEFKEFYSRYSDIYVFHECMSEIENKELSSIPVTYVSAFRDKPFRGGSSYLSFFSSLKSALSDRARPSLAAVQWASPGTISIRGSDPLFKKVEQQILKFDSSYSNAKTAYKKLRDFMTTNGWLENIAEEYEAPSIDGTILLSTLIAELAEELHTPGGRSFSLVLEGNQIVEAKIFLAVFRRLETVLDYVREGRVSIG